MRFLIVFLLVSQTGFAETNCEPCAVYDAEYEVHCRSECLAANSLERIAMALERRLPVCTD